MNRTSGNPNSFTQIKQLFIINPSGHDNFGGNSSRIMIKTLTFLDFYRKIDQLDYIQHPFITERKYSI